MKMYYIEVYLDNDDIHLVQATENEEIADRIIISKDQAKIVCDWILRAATGNSEELHEVTKR